jgi:hypothetical protein
LTVIRCLIQVLAKPVHRYSGDDLIGHSGQIHVENGISPLCGDARQDALSHYFTDRRIHHR